MAQSLTQNISDILNETKDAVIPSAHVQIAEIIKENLMSLTDIDKDWLIIFLSTIGVVLGSKITADVLSQFNIFIEILLLPKIIFKTVIGAMLTLTIIPGMLLTYVAFWIYSKIVHLYIKTTTNEKLTKANGMNAFVGLDNSISTAFIYATFKVVGKANLENSRKHLAKRVLDVRSASGELQFPNLRQIFCRRGGYFYWKEDENFDVKNHIRKISLCDMYPELSAQQNSTGQDLVCRYLEEHGTNSINKGCCPQWEFLMLVTGKNEFHYLFRCHHGIGDGLSFIRMLLEKANDTPILAENVSPLRSLPVRIAMIVWSLALIPFGIKAWLFKGKNNYLHGPKLTGKKHYIASPGFPYEIIRQIKNRSKTSAQAVLFSAISTSFGKYIRKKSDSAPSNFTVLFPIGFNDQKAELKLSNTFVIGIVSLPLPTAKFLQNKSQNDQSSLSLLYQMNRSLRKAKEDATLTSLHYVITIFVDVVPISIAKLTFTTSGITTGVSNIPGPKIPLMIAKQKLTDMRFWAPDRSPTGIITTFLTEDGILYPNLKIDTGLIKDRREAEDLMHDLTAEIKRLAKTLNIEVPETC